MLKRNLLIVSILIVVNLINYKHIQMIKIYVVLMELIIVYLIFVKKKKQQQIYNQKNVD